MTKEELLHKIKEIILKDSRLNNAQIEVIFSDKKQKNKCKKYSLGGKKDAK